MSEVFIFPASSHVKQIEYDADVEDLKITFQDERTYLYRNVPKRTYMSFTHAPSPGSFFHRQIRDRYAFEEA